MTTRTESVNPAVAAPSARGAFAAGVGTLLLWSGTPIANKIVVHYMDGLTAGLVRSTLAGLVAVVVAIALRLPFPRGGRDRLLLVVSGVFSFAAWPVVLSIGLEHTSAGHAALILATIPVIAVLLAGLLDRRAPRVLWWLGAGIAIAGCGLLVGAAPAGASGAEPGAWTPAGDAIVLAGGAICAIGYVAGGRLSPRIGTAATTFWGLSVSMIVLVPVLAAAAPETAWSAVAADGWLAMAWMSLLSSLAAYALWFYALGRGGIGRTSSMLLVMPAITLLGASIVLGEPIGWLMVVSCALVVLGTYLAHRYAR
ncbi:MAG TPA: DMT family transporter [Gammaproteobacteria bacterium]